MEQRSRIKDDAYTLSSSLGGTTGCEVAVYDCRFALRFAVACLRTRQFSAACIEYSMKLAWQLDFQI